MPTIPVVDDEQLIRWSRTSRLADEGYRVLEAETAADALKRAREGVDLVLLDYRLPDSDGLTVLKQIKENDPDTLVILLTAYSSVNSAVEAMRRGAYHYANKPFDLDEIVLLVEKALEATALRREVRALRASQAQPYSLDRIVGEDESMVAMRALLATVARSRVRRFIVTQKLSLTPNCIWRAGFPLKIRPKLGVNAMRFGTSKFTRFSRLKISHRNCSCAPLARCTAFWSPMSTSA